MVRQASCQSLQIFTFSDLRDFMPMPSLDDAQSFRHKSANEVAAWARTLGIDNDAVGVIEREVFGNELLRKK